MKKVSAKKFSSYLMAKSKGLSANENYNVQILGITTEEYKRIKDAEYHIRGIIGPKLTLKQLNDWLKNQ